MKTSAPIKLENYDRQINQPTDQPTDATDDDDFKNFSNYLFCETVCTVNAKINKRPSKEFEPQRTYFFKRTNQSKIFATLYNDKDFF